MSRRARLGLDEATANRAAEVLGKALVGGRRLTRTETIECLRAHAIPTEGQQAYHLLWYISQIGVTCIGPNVGKEPTFVLGAGLPNDKTPRVQVLPGFDEYLLGIKDRTVAVPAAHQHKIIPGGNGVFLSTMVVDGIVVGTWKRTLKKALVEIQPLPFRAIPRAIRSEFDAAFGAYARYLGVEARVTWP